MVWPDADAPGEGYADAVFRVLAAIGVTATVITPAAAAKSGWDAAALPAEIWDEERTRALVDQAGCRCHGWVWTVSLKENLISAGPAMVLRRCGGTAWCAFPRRIFWHILEIIGFRTTADAVGR